MFTRKRPETTDGTHLSSHVALAATVLLVATTAVTMGVVSERAGSASSDQTVAPAEDKAQAVTADEAFDALSELIGFAYEIGDTWSFGEPLHARNEFRDGLNSRFIESNVYLLVGENNDERGPELYRNIMARGKGKDTIINYGFAAQGEHEPVENSLSKSTEGRIILTGRWVRTEGERSTAFKQDMELRDRSYAWRVWIRPGTSTSDADEAGPWRQIMDGEWIRKEPLDQR